MDLLTQALALVGAIGTLATSLALFFPKGSKIGYTLAKVGADLKGHTCPTEKPAK